MEWISVEDRLPEINRDVLGYMDISEDGQSGDDIHVAHYNKSFGWCVSGFTMQCITHWMPLPDPPV